MKAYKTTVPLLVFLFSNLSMTQAFASEPWQEIKKLLAVQQAEIQRMKSAMVPPGMVSAWSGTSVPEGWLACNGQEVAQADYPDLFKAIGHRYATQRNSETGSTYAAPAGGKFRLPDYRGVFLRGAGKSLISGSQTIETQVGGFQDDATATNQLRASTSTSIGSDGSAHQHTVAVYGYTDSKDLYSDDRYIPRTGDSISSGRPRMTWGQEGAHVHNASSTTTLTSADPETRPQNVGVEYVIRARP